MPPDRGPLWQFFYCGKKRNTAHFSTYCRGCIDVHRPASTPIPIPIDSDSDGGTDTWALALLDEDWFKDACTKVLAVLSMKKRDYGGEKRT
ncbi:hypothetical protein B0H10DRAFT_2243844 [Mycena sp. CBHHK59/15]|nr:hypothetical protein B0H10DRAFT_2243844 [Mycena sp. CBHHK59/15]